MMKIRNKVMFASIFLMGALICAPEGGKVQAAITTENTTYNVSLQAKSKVCTPTLKAGSFQELQNEIGALRSLSMQYNPGDEHNKKGPTSIGDNGKTSDLLNDDASNNYAIIMQVKEAIETQNKPIVDITTSNTSNVIRIESDSNTASSEVLKDALTRREAYIELAEIKVDYRTVGTVAALYYRSNIYLGNYHDNTLTLFSARDREDVPYSCTSETFEGTITISFKAENKGNISKTFKVEIKGKKKNTGTSSSKLNPDTVDVKNAFEQLNDVNLDLTPFVESVFSGDDYDKNAVSGTCNMKVGNIQRSFKSNMINSIRLADPQNYKDLTWYLSKYKFSNTIRDLGTIANMTRVEASDSIIGKQVQNKSATEQDSFTNYYYKVITLKGPTVYSKKTLAAPTVADGVTYEVHDDGAYVRAINGMDSENDDNGRAVVIPEFITWKGNKYRVNKILADAKISDQVTSLTLPESIYSYPSKVFVNSKLEDVYLESVSATLGDAFPKSVNLHSYSSSAAYEKYEEQGYEGTNIPFSTKINYHLDGGENNEKNMEYYSFRTVFYPGDAVKEGYRFDGWFFDEDLTKPVTYILENDRSEDEIDIYAKWYELPEETKENTDKAETVDPSEKDDSKTEDNGVIKDLDDADYDNTKPETTGEPVQKVTLQTLDDDSLVATDEDGKTGEGEPATFNIFSAKRKIKVMLENTDAKKYEVQISTSSKFKKKATKSYKFSADASRMADTTIKNFGKTKLKVGKTYYCRVRSYAVVNGNGKKSYSGWSEVVAVKIVK